MCTDDFDARDPKEEAPEDRTIEPVASDESDSTLDKAFKTSWDRRTFLKAAALGTAAAALIGRGKDGWNLGGLTASAHNPTNVNCRANEVRITGVGRVVNEPCECEGTFTARVQVPIFNNTGTDRYCVTLHLCPTEVNDQTIGGDFLVGQVPSGNSIAEFEIPDYPCNSGTVCFGDFVEEGRERCPAGNDCCTIISWEPSPTSDDDCDVGGRLNPSKCRLQQVCIQGFGASLECVDSCDSNTSYGDPTDCSVGCGEDLHLCASASGQSDGADEGLYRFRIYDPDDNLVGDSGATLVASPRCFTISNPKEGTYRLVATDSEDCVREDSVEVTVEDATTTLEVIGTPGCDGIVTFKAGTEEGLESCSFLWEIDEEEVEDVTGDTLIYDPCELGHLDGENHTVTATAQCGDCDAAPASKTINQCVDTTIT